MTYTTAASQFLYGSTVVKAALAAQKRRFYKLYLAEGSKSETGGIRACAAKLGVEVRLLSTEAQSQMDRMSKGRPHNGVVLETSPLPQPPVKALGACTDEPAGFGVLLGWQSK